MLRVTVYEDSGEVRLQLEGQLAGLWVREVEHCWRTAERDNRRRNLTVDLGDVDFVDGAGEQLLVAMHHHGVALIATGLMVKGMVSRITGQR
jgi:anti-anti-sigma regulatory factor